MSQFGGRAFKRPEANPRMTRLAIMLSLIAAWKAKDIDAALAHFTEDIVWHYAAAIAPPVRGKDKARKLLQSLAPQVGEVRCGSSMRWRRAIACSSKASMNTCRRRASLSRRLMPALSCSGAI